jgi:hypothetical protein
MMTIGTVMCLGVLLTSGCSKNSVKWVYYDETRCDRWQYSINNEQLKLNFSEYYKARGVKIFEVEIFSDIAADPCADCTCRTGRRFKAKVSKNDAKELRKESFYE